MDNLQYTSEDEYKVFHINGFKPYYKWIIFNIAHLLKAAVIEKEF